ncbi:hypothetical protein MMPV_005546 [Pyropia vietnamensis]
MALSTEFCAHATGLAATLTGGAGGDVSSPEFHRPADRLPTFSVFVVANYEDPLSKQFTLAYTVTRALKPVSSVPRHGATAVAGPPWMALPPSESSGLRLQVAVMEADDYPRRFLATVTAVPIGLGLERAAAAAEGVADVGTLGGSLLAALRRVAATGNHYPYAWRTLGGTIASLATVWRAAGLVRPSEACETRGEVRATDGIPQRFLPPPVLVDVPPGLPQPVSIPKPTAAVAAAGSSAANNVAPTTCAACVATRLYRYATVLGSFGYRVALGASSSPANGGGGAATITYSSLIAGVPLLELPIEESVLHTWGLSAGIPDSMGGEGPSGSETPLRSTTCAGDGMTTPTRCSPLLVVEVSGDSLAAAVPTKTRDDSAAMETRSPTYGVPSGACGSVHMADWAAVVRSWAGSGPPTAVAWPLTDCIQRSLTSAATTFAPRFTTTSEEATAAVSCPPLALLRVASARVAAFATACVMCDADTGAAAGHFGSCPAICVKGGPDSCVAMNRRRVASGGWQIPSHRPALEACSWPEPELQAHQPADNRVPTGGGAQTVDSVAAGEGGAHGDRRSGDGGGSSRIRVPASALACLGAVLRSQPAAVDLLLFLAGAAAVFQDGSALDPSPPFLQTAVESGRDNGGGGGSRRSPTLPLSPSGRHRFVSALRATPCVADLAAAAARSDADLLAALDDAHPEAAAIAAWVVASMPGVIRALPTVNEPAGESSPHALASGLPPRSFLLSGGDPAGEWAFQVAANSAAVALSTAAAARTSVSPTGTKETTKYVFHGSPWWSWHSILRNGLDTRVTNHGRAFGHGVYVSDRAEFAAWYGLDKRTLDPGYVASLWAQEGGLAPAVVGAVEAVDIKEGASPLTVPQLAPLLHPEYEGLRLVQIVPEGGVRLRGLILDYSAQKKLPDVQSGLSQALPHVFQQVPAHPIAETPTLKEVADTTVEAAAKTSVPAGRSVRLPPSWRRPSQPVLDGRVPGDGPLREAPPPTACVAHAPAAGAAAAGTITSGRLSPGAAARIMRDLQAVARNGREHGLVAWPASSAAVAAAAAADLFSSAPVAATGHPLPSAVGEDLTVVHVHMGNWESAGGDALPLAMDLVAAGIDGLLWEVRFPPTYPAMPPFVRLLRPRMRPWAAGGGGHLTSGGSVCLAVLTPAAWAPSMELLELLLTIRAAVGDPHPVPARVDRDRPGGYGLGEALCGYARVGEAHGWLPLGRGRDVMSWVGQ